MFKNLSPRAIGITTNMQDGLHLAKSVGFEGLDLPINEANSIAKDYSVNYVSELWQASGLKMGGWGFPLNFRGTDAEYEESLLELPNLAKLAADLGCFRVTTGVLPASDVPFRENWEFHVNRLRPGAEILNEYGHSLGIEFISPATLRKPQKHLFTYTMDAVLGLAAAIGTGNVGLLFDMWHWYTCHATVDDVKKLTAEDIVYVHINDAPAGIVPDSQIDQVRCLPGATGVIPVSELLQILDTKNYDGPVTPEPFSADINAMNPHDAANETSKSLNTVWKEANLRY